MQQEEEDLRRWARGAFRPATMRGDLRSMRRRALSSPRREMGAEERTAVVGGAGDAALFVAASTLAVAGAIWWLSRLSMRRSSGVSSYLAAIDALAAR